MQALLSRLEGEIGKLAMALLNQGVINDHKEQLSAIQTAVAVLRQAISDATKPNPPVTPKAK